MTKTELNDLIDETVDALFTNSSGQIAERLVLTAGERDLGGWGRGPIKDRLLEMACKIQAAEKLLRGAE